MLFPTIDFAVFFAVVFVGHWVFNPSPRRWRYWMLAASYVFYGWADWHLIGLLAASTAVTWLGGAAVSRANSKAGRNAALWSAVAAHLGLLGWFKYAGFASSNLVNLLRSLGLPNAVPVVAVALPIGVSFFTFMGLSYVIDIWRRQLEPAPLLDVAVFVSFFPHLVAGPIVRGSELLPQFRVRRDANEVDYPQAAWLIVRGLFKKVVISSFVASAIVDPVFAAPKAHAGLEILVAVYAYAVQIYADFSGYTDIAIGVALLLGFRFPQNFDSPYTARSLQDFWRRWHMTLSRWLRDYLYIPLGGSRGSKAETVRNIILTMALAGLWHGAGWTFVAWGLFHGVGQAIGYLRRDAKSAAATAVRPSPARLAVQRLVTFHLVCLGWVLFRADSVRTAWVVLTRLPVAGPAPLVTPLLLAVIAASLAVQFVPAGAGAEARRWLAGRSVLVQGATLSAALVAITSLGPQGVAPFIYYRF